MPSDAPSAAILQTRALTKEFRGFRAVSEVDLTSPRARVHALVGPNGAGKTTLFNLLTGFLTPTLGHRSCSAASDITGKQPEQIAHLGIARSFQITSLFDQMSLVEHLELALASPTGLGYRFWRSSKRMRQFRHRAMELLEQVGLADRAGAAGRVPRLRPEARPRARPRAGARPQAAAARRADRRHGPRGRRPHHRPRQAGRRAGAPSCFVDHNMHVVGSLADTVTVLQSGQVLAEGTYEQVRADERVITAYLGHRRVASTASAESDRTASSVLDVAVRPGTARRGSSPTSRSPSRPARSSPWSGRNGAGKTTLLRSVMGLHRQVEGAIALDGSDARQDVARQPGPAGIGWVPDDRGIYASLTVAENLTLPPVVNKDAWSLEQVYEQFPVLHERRDFPGTKLSGGEQQMLAMARVLRMGSRLLLLDEPSEGLAPVIVQRIGEIIRQIKAQGVSVLLVEQNVKFASTVADRHYLLAQGRVVESLDNEAFQSRTTRAARVPRNVTVSPSQPASTITPQEGTCARSPSRWRPPPSAAASCSLPVAAAVPQRGVGQAHRRQGRPRSAQRPVRRLQGPVRPQQQGRHPDGHRRLQGQVRRQGGRQEHRDRPGRPPEQAGHRQHQGAGDVRPRRRPTSSSTCRPPRPRWPWRPRPRRRRSSTSTSAPAPRP